MSRPTAITFALLLACAAPLAAQQNQHIAYNYTWNDHQTKGAGDGWSNGYPCGDGCGEAGCGIGDFCLPHGHLYMGAEATFLSPVFNDGGASPVNLTYANPTNAWAYPSGMGNAEYLTAAPRIWLGYQWCTGWGIAMRYWQMTTTGTASDPYDPVSNPGDAFALQTGEVYKAYTIDWEATRDFAMGDWDLLGTFGLRQGALERSASLSSIGLAGTGVTTASGWAERDYSGFGLTLSLSGNRPLGWSDWEVFWRARGSALWGEAKSSASTLAATAAPGINISSLSYDYASSDETLGIGEFQTGLMWSREIRAFNARSFATIAFEYQYWDLGAANVSAVSAAGSPGLSAVSVAAGGPNLHSHLIGFALGAGFVW